MDKRGPRSNPIELVSSWTPTVPPNYGRLPSYDTYKPLPYLFTVLVLLGIVVAIGMGKIIYFFVL